MDIRLMLYDCSYRTGSFVMDVSLPTRKRGKQKAECPDSHPPPPSSLLPPHPFSCPSLFASMRFLRRHHNPILTLGLLPTSSQQQANARGMGQTQLCGVQIPLPNFQKGGRGLKCIELCARFFHPSLALMKAAARMIREGGDE